MPGVDHKAQLARLSAIDDHSARRVPVRTSKCLGICFQANVVVVQPSQEGRAAGGRPVWLGRMTEDKLLDAVDDWIFEGGPGIVPLPAVLEDHVTSKDAKKPKKRKKPKHSKSAKKERKEAKEKLAKQAKKDRKKARKKAAEAAPAGTGPLDGPVKNKAAKDDAKKDGGKKGSSKKSGAEGKKSKKSRKDKS
ncbi:(2Fe-2S) ferredoxin domain-containing protein [Nocardiopsis ganjiahuensis]|uniref:(2Fe-2S) ferredoxin domain-containing protein n=1 Tax=Nocardiopsis ganjiahuensis TaxID=239984 RepID=UPI0012679DBA|nr:(2Fe-2S) ferredoxin domain-containing protein [Nocardiopsis ganjiahuensis]